MTYSFNLVDEPWVPCLDVGSSRSRLRSLRDVLGDAHAIAEVADPSPLVTVALHRLLLAVVHRCFAIPDMPSWSALWEAERFDPAVLDDYWDAWRHRFDLFDVERPFYQVAGLPESVAVSIAKLTLERSSGNNAVLFDHSWDAAPHPVTAAEAARLVVAQQAFALGGLITRLPGDPPSAEASDLIKGGIVMVAGVTLFETLVLNAVRVNGRDGAPFPFDPSDDGPAWEQDSPAARETRDSFGYLDYLTWQSRRILLFPEAAESAPVVGRVTIMGGRQLPPDVSPNDRETMVAFRKLEKPARGQDAMVPVGLKPERAVWRDSLSLMEGAGPFQRPRTMAWLGDLAIDYRLTRSTLETRVFGLSSDRAKVFLWRAERIELPTGYLYKDSLVAWLAAALKAAEGVRWAIESSARDVAGKVLEPLGKADPARIKGVVQSLAPERAYWAGLDVPFRRFIIALAGATSEEAANDVRISLADEMRDSARTAFESFCRALETGSRGYFAAADTAGRFAFRLNQSLAELRGEPTENTRKPMEVSS